MVGGNSAAANWWSLNNMRPPPPQQHQQLTGSSPLMAAPSPSSSSSSSAFPHPYSLGIQDVLPDSWSQLLLGGYVGEEERCSFTHFLPKVENWDHNHSVAPPNMVVDVKQEGCELMYGHGNTNIHEEIQLPSRNSWRSQQHMLPVSSPRSSCITTFSSNMLDFSTSKSEGKHPKHDQQPSSECNSTETASALKKPRLQVSSSPQSTTFKVRKEKLGDRITVLHQLVSPFGKTDTASVLLEAIGYIRFLQSQIEALSSPYLGNAVSTSTRHPGQGERSCIFPEDPGQLLNDACMKRRGPCESKDAKDEMTKDLRSRGLCLVPLSCTMHFGSDNGADYWAPAYGSGGGNGGFR